MTDSSLPELEQPSSLPTTLTAVILAAGRGTRMQKTDASVHLTPEQEAAADRGLKMLVPIHGRPYVAYILHELAEAGFEDVCFVVGPGPDNPVRRAIEELDIRRLHVSFAVQEEPLGSAHALLAAETFVGRQPCIVINGDNIYSAAALRAVAALPGSGLAGYEPEALVRHSNVTPDQVAAFAIIEVVDGFMVRVVEKPDLETIRELAGAPVSMTLWRFEPSIFDACRDVEPSPRGELELAGAVELAMDRGARFQVVPVAEGVLDISRRADIPAVEHWLEGVEPRP